MQRSFKSSKLQRVKHCCKQSSSHVSPASDAKTWSFVSHFMDHRNWSSVFKLLADSASDCELGERCIRQSDENFSSWYVWFLMLFFLALLLSCGICCCLQCWLKRRSCLPHRRTQTVFALSSSDAFCASEAPQCLFSGSLSPCMTTEMSSSPAPRFSLGETELPPSYEDIMKENKL
ncbi:transmembrane protein 207 isoform X2 [Pezoporus occidentalis]|uniref:transmembrane protein 207 isoform X2 n=1 Tax=Pezoporus occidentalis TaxID=407982 RepID=UPI002F90BA4E